MILWFISHNASNDGDNAFHDFNVAFLIESADIVHFAHSAMAEHHINALAVVFHIEPIAHIQPLAIHRKRFAVTDIVDKERYQFLRELVRAIVVGTGNVGKAITLYAEFKKSGFNIVGLFDKSESLVGTKIDDLEIMDISQLTEFQNKYKPEIAILAAPGEVAQDLCDTLVDNGIKGIWNFAPIDLKLSKDIVLEDVHLDESLYTLIYYINNINDYDIKK